MKKELLRLEVSLPSISVRWQSWMTAWVMCSSEITQAESIHVEPPALGVVGLTLLTLPTYKPKEARRLNLNWDKTDSDYRICHCCGELNPRVPNLRLKEVSNGLGKN